jgi:RNA polymerase sigma factor (TIGR02999 family)
MRHAADRRTLGADPERPADPESADRLYERAYDQLKALAHRVRAGRAGETLSTTALVNEAWLKLANGREAAWRDRAHFFAVAARAMRQILVDGARRRLAVKRGGAGAQLITLDESVQDTPVRPEQLLALDDALTELAALDPRRASVVEQRYFAGLSVEETARILGISTATVERDWRLARAWLATALKGESAS